MTRARTSPAHPPVSGPSSTTTMRFVFATEASTVGMSSGRSVRRSMTSAAMPSAGELIGRLERLVHAVHRGDDRDVRALAARRRPAERHGLAVDLARDAVEPLVLEEEHRVVVPDGRAAAGPSRRPASAGVTIFRPGTPMNHETGICEWIAPKRPPAPDDRADHERHAHLLAGQEPVLRRLVDEAVHRRASGSRRT